MCVNMGFHIEEDSNKWEKCMIVAIIQARTGSSRFPRKIYEDINGKYNLQRVLEGVSASQVPHTIVLAMPDYDKKELMNRVANKEFDGVVDNRFRTYFGSSDDLVDRYFQAARNCQADLVVRITADCPLIQGKIIDEMLIEYMEKGYNGLMGNNELISDSPFPDGTDVEIFPYWMLADTMLNTNDPYHREHVTPYMYRNGTRYNIYQFRNRRPNTMISNRISDFSFDTAEDLKVIKKIAKRYDKHKDLNRAILETEL